MAPDLDPVAAHRRLAPHPVAETRAVDEQPAALRVAAAAHPRPIRAEGDGGRQELVDDAIPAFGSRVHGVVRAEPEGDRGQGRVDPLAPGSAGQLRIVGQGAHERADVAQPGQLPGRGQRRRRRDMVRAQELVGIGRLDQMVVRRLIRLRSTTVVGTRAMRAVGESQRGFGAETPCNGIHGH